jgi:hypothetical protein
MSLDPRRLPLDALLVAGITALITAARLLPVPLAAAASVAVACIARAARRPRNRHCGGCGRRRRASTLACGAIFRRRRAQVASYGAGKHLPRRKTALIEEGLKRRNMAPAQRAALALSACTWSSSEVRSRMKASHSARPLRRRHLGILVRGRSTGLARRLRPRRTVCGARSRVEADQT